MITSIKEIKSKATGKEFYLVGYTDERGKTEEKVILKERVLKKPTPVPFKPNADIEYTSSGFPIGLSAL